MIILLELQVIGGHISGVAVPLNLPPLGGGLLKNLYGSTAGEGGLDGVLSAGAGAEIYDAAGNGRILGGRGGAGGALDVGLAHITLGSGSGFNQVPGTVLTENLDLGAALELGNGRGGGGSAGAEIDAAAGILGYDIAGVGAAVVIGAVGILVTVSADVEILDIADTAGGSLNLTPYAALGKYGDVVAVFYIAVGAIVGAGAFAKMQRAVFIGKRYVFRTRQHGEREGKEHNKDEKKRELAFHFRKTSCEFNYILDTFIVPQVPCYFQF